MTGKIDLSAIRGCLSGADIDKFSDFVDRMPEITEVFSKENDLHLLRSIHLSVYNDGFVDYLGVPRDVIEDHMAGLKYGPAVKTLIRAWNKVMNWGDLDWTGRYIGTAIRLWCEENDINNSNMFEAWVYVLAAFFVDGVYDTIRPFMLKMFIMYHDKLAGVDCDDFCRLVKRTRYMLDVHHISPVIFSTAGQQ